MTFARLLLEIRRRASQLPDDGQRPEAIERIAREILAEIPEGEQADKVRRILAAFLGLGEGDEFDVGRTSEAVRALRGALLRPAN